MSKSWSATVNPEHAYRRATLRDQHNAKKKHRMLCRRAQMAMRFARYGFPRFYEPSIRRIAEQHGLAPYTIRKDILWAWSLYQSVVDCEEGMADMVREGTFRFVVKITPAPENEVIAYIDMESCLKEVQARNKHIRHEISQLRKMTPDPSASQKRSERRRKQKTRERSGKSRPSLDTLDLVQVAEAFDGEIERYFIRLNRSAQ
jgi:hypothetical protein